MSDGPIRDEHGQPRCNGCTAHKRTPRRECLDPDAWLQSTQPGRETEPFSGRPITLYSDFAPRWCPWLQTGR